MGNNVYCFGQQIQAEIGPALNSREMLQWGNKIAMHKQTPTKLNELMQHG